MEAGHGGDSTVSMCVSASDRPVGNPFLGAAA